MTNLLILYEIADKAAKVTSRNSLRQFEKWIAGVVQSYHDAALERVAAGYLFRLKGQYSV